MYVNTNQSRRSRSRVVTTAETGLYEAMKQKNLRFSQALDRGMRGLLQLADIPDEETAQKDKIRELEMKLAGKDLKIERLAKLLAEMKK